MNVINGLLRRAALVPAILLLVGQVFVAKAQTVLIDFGSDTSFRGLSVQNPDSLGHSWNSVQPGLFVENMVDLNGATTMMDLGWDTPVATDSYNGPAGPTDASTLTTDVLFTDVDASALGNLGGALEGPFDYASGYNGTSHFPVRFQIQQLNPAAKYDLTFFGSHSFSDDTTTVYTVFSDSTYTTPVASTTLDVQDADMPWMHNRDQMAILSNVSPQTDNILYIEFVGSTGKGGYLNDMQIEAVAAPLAGDYNGDHAVNGLDLDAWKDQFGQSSAGLTADGNGDGCVDGGDFLIWQKNVGAAAITAVPEPLSLAMLGFGLVGFGAIRGRFGGGACHG